MGVRKWWQKCNFKNNIWNPRLKYVLQIHKVYVIWFYLKLITITVIYFPPFWAWSLWACCVCFIAAVVIASFSHAIFYPYKRSWSNGHALIRHSHIWLWQWWRLSLDLNDIEDKYWSACWLNNTWKSFSIREKEEHAIRIISLCTALITFTDKNKNSWYYWSLKLNVKDKIKVQSSTNQLLAFMWMVNDTGVIFL